MREELSLILARDDKGTMRLWACRGEGKGCQRNQFRKRKAQCPDCIGPLDETLTMGQVVELVARGDA